MPRLPGLVVLVVADGLERRAARAASPGAAAPEQPEGVPGRLPDEVHGAGAPVASAKAPAGSTAGRPRRPTPGPSRRWRRWSGRSSPPELERRAVAGAGEREARPSRRPGRRTRTPRTRRRGRGDRRRRPARGARPCWMSRANDSIWREVAELLELRAGRPRGSPGRRTSVPLRSSSTSGSSSRRTTPSGADAWTSHTGVSPRRASWSRPARGDPVSKRSVTSACSSTGWSSAPSSTARTSTGRAGAASSSATASGCDAEVEEHAAAPALGEEVAPRRAGLQRPHVDEVDAVRAAPRGARARRTIGRVDEVLGVGDPRAASRPPRPGGRRRPGWCTAASRRARAAPAATSRERVVERAARAACTRPRRRRPRAARRRCTARRRPARRRPRPAAGSRDATRLMPRSGHVVDGVAVDRGDPPCTGEGEVDRRSSGHATQVPRSAATTGAIGSMVSPWNTMYDTSHRSRRALERLADLLDRADAGVRVGVELLGRQPEQRRHHLGRALAVVGDDRRRTAAG